MGGSSTAAVITTALSVVIAASRPRVWRAITEPAERIRWDESMLALLEPAEDYPCPGRDARWRYQLGNVPVILRDRPVEVVPGERLRSEVRLGLFRFDQSWSLRDEPGAERRTRLGLRLAASNAIAVVGGVIDRFDVRRLAAEYVDAKLRSLQKWCEND